MGYLDARVATDNQMGQAAWTKAVPQAARDKKNDDVQYRVDSRKQAVPCNKP